MVEIEQPAKTRRLDDHHVARRGPFVREGDQIVQTLVVSFMMMVGEVFPENVAQ